MSHIRHSIIIPTYNRGTMLLDAVASAKRSLLPKSEIIVVNDGNELNASVLKYLQQNGVVCVETRGAMGAGAARNTGANAAKGSWLFFLDDDDMIAPNYWMSVAQYISDKFEDDDPAYGFCRSRSFTSRDDMKNFHANANTSFTIVKVTETSLKPKLSGLGVGFWVSKQLFFSVDGISESIKVNEDTDFCLRLLKAEASCNASNSVGALIYSGEMNKDATPSTTKSTNALQRMLYFSEIIQEHEELLLKDNKTAFWLFKRYTKMAGRARQFSAIHCILKSKLLGFPQKFLLTGYFFLNLRLKLLGSNH